MRGGAAALALSLLALGCGEPARVEPLPEGPWRQASVVGMPPVTAACVHEGWLLLAAGDERRLFALETAALRPGARLTPVALPLELRRERPLEGHAQGRAADELAAQGYTLGQVWEQPLELGGLSVRRVAAQGGVAVPDVERLHLLERVHGVVFWGQLERDAAGRPRAVRLEAGFAVPGRRRGGAARLDWRETGPGLAGLLAPPRPDAEEDLLLVERGGRGESQARLLTLDRFGQPRGSFRVPLPPGLEPPVRAMGMAPGRFILLLDGPPAQLVAVPLGARGDVVALAAREPAPPPPEGAAWRALAYAADGTEILVSGGREVVVAWR